MRGVDAQPAVDLPFSAGLDGADPSETRGEAPGEAAPDGEFLLQWLMRSRRMVAGAVVFRPGAQDLDVHFVRSGWACEFRTAPAGRQIVSLVLPGDFCGLTLVDGGRGSSGLAAITDCDIASIPRSEVLQTLQGRPQLSKAIWRAAAVWEQILAERLLSLGRRPALERMAHLLCEIMIRERREIAPEPPWFPLPLSQADLADVLGMSTVHVNRVLQALRTRGLVELRRGRCRVTDFDRLAKLAAFDPAYLDASGVLASDP